MGIQEDVEALKRIPLFAKVEPAKLKLLAFAAERAQYMPGEALFHQGDQADAAYIVLGGKADVLVETQSGPLKVAEVGKDAFVGEIGILCDVPRTATIKAKEPLATLKITKDMFYRLVAEVPQMAIEVMRELAHRLEDTNQKLREATAKKAA